MYDLTDKEKSMLRLICTGHNTHCNLVDFLGETSPAVMYSVVKLKALGLVESLGDRGNDTIAYRLTKAGEEAAELSETDKKLYSQYGICRTDLIALRFIVEMNKPNPVAVGAKMGSSAMQIICIAENLQKHGYIQMPGFVRCKLRPTEKGCEVVTKCAAVN